METGIRAVSTLWVVALAAVLLGCAGATKRPAMADHRAQFEEEDTLQVPLDRSPSGSSAFDFCPTTSPAQKVNLQNAAWLAFMAANEYSHLRFFAQSLKELGFGSPENKDFDWERCAVDLRVVRGFEASHKGELKEAFARGPKALRDYLTPFTQADHPETWGICAGNWFDDSGYEGREYPAAAFEKYLIQTAHPGHHLQFFSGGEFVLEGRAFTEGSTQVVFARHRELPVVVISFRGTEPDKWTDVAVDGKAWKSPMSDHGWPESWGSAHKGFLSAYQSVAEVLEAKLDELKGSDVGIWITGHSLGAALATVLSAKIMRDMEAGTKLALRGVYTFGSPRVGNTPFRDRYNEAAAQLGVRVVRFRNGNDLVTHIPGLMDYEHVGVLAHLTEEGLDFDPAAEPKYGGLGAAGDHNMVGWDPSMAPLSGYYRRLLEVLQKHPSGSPLNSCPSAADAAEPAGDPPPPEAEAEH